MSEDGKNKAPKRSAEAIQEARQLKGKRYAQRIFKNAGKKGKEREARKKPRRRIFIMAAIDAKSK